MDVSSSVSEGYLRRYTAVPGAFLQRRKNASHSPGSESCAGRPDMTFLDFWSISSALYGPDEGPKDAATVAASFKPSSDA